MKDDKIDEVVVNLNGEETTEEQRKAAMAQSDEIKVQES